AVAALVALAPLTLPMPLPLPLPLGSSLIWNGRARPDACSSAALATISALSASFSARVRLRAGFSTTTSFPFLFSRPISTDVVRNTNAARKKQPRQIVEHLASACREDAAGAAAAWGCGCVVGLRRGWRGGVEHGGASRWRHVRAA